VVLAVIGAVLVVSYASGADARAVKALDPWKSWWWLSLVPAGTAVESPLPFLTAQTLPGTAVAKSAVRTLDTFAGKVTAVELLPGEQLVAGRLTAPEALQSSGAVQVPEGLHEISFQLDPQRVVGGRLVAGDTIGIFISLKGGGIEAKPDKETTQLTLHKVLVTSVQRAASAAPSPEPTASGSAAPVEDTPPPPGRCC
jgi:pilus assembly protein CpaB